MMLPQLKRVRWGVRAALALGVAASVTANVLHARDNPISQVIAAWPPCALLLTIELISRVPVHSRRLAVARMAATVAIAGIAAWVSYWHMAGVVSRYGETGAAPFLMPFSVDGLVIVASVCLVELAGRIRTAGEDIPAAVEPVTEAPETAAAETPAVAITPDIPAAPQRTRKRTAKRPSTAAKVAKLAARMPDATPDTIAAKTGVSPRTVRRHLAAMTADATPDGEPVNNHTPELATT